jgi:hypothetical protein
VKPYILLCAALGGSFAVPAGAQSVSDDVRCVLVSAGFARAAKDDNSRRVSALTGAFYLGRLNGRVSQPQLVAAIKGQGKGLSAKLAEPIMRACAARAQTAETALASAAKQAETGK